MPTTEEADARRARLIEELKTAVRGSYWERGILTTRAVQEEAARYRYIHGHDFGSDD